VGVLVVMSKLPQSICQQERTPSPLALVVQPIRAKEMQAESDYTP
jgi:hypothetical protein